ncbi:precorrin-3B synthase [Salicola sp. Rm-C-2C1-2]|uniref:precorrin-3B synthase n=1 Tax=Salicola sp. Rm-C-2C1-2 TaxID=3141321 RepID=UPI0032E47552
MTTPDDYRRGACPSAGNPMASGDGLLSRIRLVDGRLTPAALRQVAGLAEQYGNGLIEITGRGNLQLRGLSENAEAMLTSSLVASGLATETPAAEAARNIQCSAAADLDPDALIDPAPEARTLDERIINDERLWTLPAKFRFVLNGGGLTHLAQADGDIRADAVSTPDGIRYRIGLGGTASTAAILGNCTSSRVVDVLVDLALMFLKERQRVITPARRMQQLINVAGKAPFAGGCELARPGGMSLDAPPTLDPGPTPAGTVLGIALGCLSTSAARQIAERLEMSNETVRITPQRRLILSHTTASTASLPQSPELIQTPEDPRLSAIACPGTPGCASGTTATRQDAMRWAEQVPELFDGNTPVHISGCPKGCAHPGKAPVVLVARNGRYDIVLSDRALPDHEHHRIAQDLLPGEVPEALRALVSTAKQQSPDDEPLTQALERLAQASRNSL